MRRIRGNYVIQPFVTDSGNDESALDAAAPAESNNHEWGPSEKMLDVEWNSPGLGLGSNVSLLHHQQQQQPKPDTPDSPDRPESEGARDDDEAGVSPLSAAATSSESPPSSNSTSNFPQPTPAPTPTARERQLEERLAQLEAHVAGALPPPPYMTE